MDDVSMSDLNSLEWSPCADAANEDETSAVPSGPTSCCEDHVLLLSATDGGSDQKACVEWEHTPSSRGLNGAAPLANVDNDVSPYGGRGEEWRDRAGTVKVAVPNDGDMEGGSKFVSVFLMVRGSDFACVVR